MSTYFNVTTLLPETENVSHVVVNGVRDPNVVYTFAAVVLAAVVTLSGFQGGRKVLRHAYWFVDSMLGGAPHKITLPGPSGLPLAGNITHVSNDFFKSPNIGNIYSDLWLQNIDGKRPHPKDFRMDQEIW